jgi:hypothetical protein
MARPMTLRMNLLCVCIVVLSCAVPPSNFLVVAQQPPLIVVYNPYGGGVFSKLQSYCFEIGIHFAPRVSDPEALLETIQLPNIAGVWITYEDVFQVRSVAFALQRFVSSGGRVFVEIGSPVAVLGNLQLQDYFDISVAEEEPCVIGASYRNPGALSPLFAGCQEIGWAWASSGKMFFVPGRSYTSRSYVTSIGTSQQRCVFAQADIGRGKIAFLAVGYGYQVGGWFVYPSLISDNDAIDLFDNKKACLNVARWLVDGFESRAGTLSIDTIPMKGEVFVNGTSWGIAPQTKFLSVGTYVITFGPAQGYSTPASQVVSIGTGESIDVTGTYTQLKYTVSFHTTPSNVGSVDFGGTRYTDSLSGQFSAGSYTVVANVPSGYTFDGWTASGEVYLTGSAGLSSTTVTVSGTGSLMASFQSPPIDISTILMVGVGGLVLVIVTWVLFRSRRRESAVQDHYTRW